MKLFWWSRLGVVLWFNDVETFFFFCCHSWMEGVLLVLVSHSHGCSSISTMHRTAPHERTERTSHPQTPVVPRLRNPALILQQLSEASRIITNISIGQYKESGFTRILNHLLVCGRGRNHLLVFGLSPRVCPVINEKRITLRFKHPF